MTEQFFISSPIGLLKICIKKNQLYSVSRENQKAVPDLKILDTNWSYTIIPPNNVKKRKLSLLARQIKQQLKNYFSGTLQSFNISLFMRGTDFQKKVWKSLQKIPLGQTKTYGQLARQLKTPKSSRAVGNCCARNPFLIVVPCHRVLSQTGLGGFALGLKTKKYLLSLEQAQC